MPRPGQLLAERNCVCNGTHRTDTRARVSLDSYGLINFCVRKLNPDEAAVGARVLYLDRRNRVFNTRRVTANLDFEGDTMCVRYRPRQGEARWHSVHMVQIVRRQEGAAGEILYNEEYL